MKKKTKIFYKLGTFLAFAIPVPLYMLFLVFAYNVTPDYTINNVEISDISVVERDEGYFIPLKENAVYDGIIAFDDVLGVYGLYIKDGDIIKVDKKMYQYDDDFVVMNRSRIKKVNKYDIDWVVWISVFAILIVALIVGGKMTWMSAKIGVLLSLAIGTIVLRFVNVIAENMFNVFLWSLVSWAIYLAISTTEDIHKKMLIKAEAERLRNKTIKNRG